MDENLTEVERKAAWEEYENEKKGLIQTNIGIENITNFGAMLQNMLPRSGDGRVMASPINPMAIQEQLRVMNPGQFPPPSFRAKKIGFSLLLPCLTTWTDFAWRNNMAQVESRVKWHSE